MLAAAKYIGAGFFFYSSIKEMKSIKLFSAICALVFIFHVLYIHSIGFCLTGIIDLLLSFSPEFLEIDTNTSFETFGFGDKFYQFSSGFIVSSKSDSSVSLECSSKPKVKRLTKVEQNQHIIPENLKQILVGLFLGDLWANKRGVNTRLRFKQGTCHKDYISHLYELFANFCPQAPKMEISLPHKLTGKLYETMLFYTYSLPCFSEFFSPFYSEGQKIIPSNIGDLLTPLGLCY